jgi:hypothetical protein
MLFYLKFLNILDDITFLETTKKILHIESRLIRHMEEAIAAGWSAASCIEH